MSKTASNPDNLLRWASAPRTKLVATLGPATNDPRTIVQLIEAGVDVFRLNMAHGDLATHGESVHRIRAASSQVGRPVGILVDLAGPKIRLGALRTDPWKLVNDQRVNLVRGLEPQRDDEMTSNFATLLDEVQVGHELVLGDGAARLVIESLTADQATCRVIDGGVVRSRQGISLPATTLSVPALGDADRRHAQWAGSADVDYVSLSFVRQAGEIEELRQILSGSAHPRQIVAKIEKREALENLSSIIAAADAVMVARGDLGLEIAIERTPLVQKRIIRKCRELKKPVIVATQMLESMHHHKLPTRAEVSDVANAILDGADACMLSGETAIGEYPLDAVRMMKRIMGETEQELATRRRRPDPGDEQRRWPIIESMMDAAAQIAKQIQARWVLIASGESRQALFKSKQRDFVPTVCLTDHPPVAQCMSLYWGIRPVLVDDLPNFQRIPQRVLEWARDQGGLVSGDRLVMILDSDASASLHDAVMVGEIA